MGENMRITRWAAPLGAAGLLSFTLTGCEVKDIYEAHCITTPFVAGQDHGMIDVVADVPPEVNPGQTFTVTVNEIGVLGSHTDNPPPARFATITLAGAVSPSGNITIGSMNQPAVWPRQIQVTATGQVGQNIVISLYQADQHLTSPISSHLSCHALGDTTLTTIPIVAPKP
jgi:hypothetical protein